MDRIEKALNKLNETEKKKLKEILLQVARGDFHGLDLKKLRGRKDIFRVRKGSIRVMFRKTDDCIRILRLERRGNKTYRK